MKMGGTAGHVVNLQSAWVSKYCSNTMRGKSSMLSFVTTSLQATTSNRRSAVCVPCSQVGAATMLRGALTPAARSGRSSSPGGEGSQGWTRTSARSPSALPLSVGPSCSVTSSTARAACVKRTEEKQSQQLDLVLFTCIAANVNAGQR